MRIKPHYKSSMISRLTVHPFVDLPRLLSTNKLYYVRKIALKSVPSTVTGV